MSNLLDHLLDVVVGCFHELNRGLNRLQVGARPDRLLKLLSSLNRLSLTLRLRILRKLHT